MSKMLLSVVVALTLAAVARPASASHGQDTELAGTLLHLQTPASGKNRVTYRSTSIFVDSGNGGTTGDPTCSAQGGGGGVVEVTGLGGSFQIVLPCSGWRHTNSGVYNADYQYRDRSGATCSRVDVRHGRVLRVACAGPQVAYQLGQPQGDVSVSVRLGSAGERNCATFGPPPTRVVQDGSNGRSYVARESPRPEACATP